MSKYWLILFLLFGMVGCKTQKTVEVPVRQAEKITERLIPVVLPPDSTLFDALLACDSLNNVYVKELSESKTRGVVGNWMLNDNRLIYKTVVKKDTVYLPRTDKEIYVEIPVKVEVEKEINVLTTWQAFQVWIGRIAMGVAGIFLIFSVVKSKFNF